MGNCCCKKTHLIFALGTNDSFLKALQSIEDKCYKHDEIIVLWTGSPAYDILNNIEWKNTSHNVRASSNNATRDVHELIKYYQDNGWNLKVIVVNKNNTRGISVDPRNNTFFCKNNCSEFERDTSSSFSGIIDLLGIRSLAMNYLKRTPISSRTDEPRGSYCADIKTFAALFMYLEQSEKFEAEYRYLKDINFEEGQLPLYFEGENTDSIKILKYNSIVIDRFDDDYTDFLMYKIPEFYDLYVPNNMVVMAICTDLGDPYNESDDTESNDLVNDFDDLVAIAMISNLKGKANIYVDMPDKNVEETVRGNVQQLIDTLEVTNCSLFLK